MNIQEAIAAVKANPPDDVSPMPWGAKKWTLHNSNGEPVADCDTELDAACIAARVTSAPLLIAEVERLQTVVEAARVAVEKWPGMEHSEFCRGWFVPGDDRTECTCGAWHHEKALADLRRALGLEG